MKQHSRVGEIHETTSSGKLEIIAYKNATNATVKFEDGTIIDGIRYEKIQKGNVKNHNIPRVYGLGFMGVGKYSFSSHKRLYKMWSKMFERCYCPKFHEYRPTYIGCSVDKEWHSFQNYCEWVIENYHNNYDGLVLDKDIKTKGNKVYSPKDCFLVNNEINVLFTKSDAKRGDLPIGVTDNRFGKFASALRRFGKTKHLGTFDTPTEAFEVYKDAKIIYIKEVADLFKDETWMTDELYNSMLSYVPNIDD